MMDADSDRKFWREKAFEDTVNWCTPMGAARLVRRDPILLGGYERVLVTTDGGLLCHKCVEENWSRVSEGNRMQEDTGWCPDHEESTELFENGEVCDHCGRWLDAYHDEDLWKEEHSNEG